MAMAIQFGKILIIFEKVNFMVLKNSIEKIIGNNLMKIIDIFLKIK